MDAKAGECSYLGPEKECYLCSSDIGDLRLPPRLPLRGGVYTMYLAEPEDRKYGAHS